MQGCCLNGKGFMRRIFRSRDILIGCGCAGFNDFFYTIAQMYQAEIAAMPRRNRLLPLMLLQRLGDDYDEKWMAELKSRCCLHKLNYRVPAEVLAKRNNFYHSIVNVK